MIEDVAKKWGQVHGDDANYFHNFLLDISRGRRVLTRVSERELLRSNQIPEYFSFEEEMKKKYFDAVSSEHGDFSLRDLEGNQINPFFFQMSTEEIIFIDKPEEDQGGLVRVTGIVNMKGVQATFFGENLIPTNYTSNPSVSVSSYFLEENSELPKNVGRESIPKAHIDSIETAIWRAHGLCKLSWVHKEYFSSQPARYS